MARIWKRFIRWVGMGSAVVVLAWLFTQSITSFQHGEMGEEAITEFVLNETARATLSVNPSGDQFVAISVTSISDEAPFIILSIDRTFLEEPARGRNYISNRSRISRYENGRHHDVACASECSSLRLAVPSTPRWIAYYDFEFVPSPARRTLAAYFRGAENEADSGVLIWELGTPDRVHRFEAGFVSAIAFSSDSTQMAFATKSGECGLLDLDSRRIADLPKGKVPADAVSIGASHRGDLLAVASESGIVQIWSVPAKRCISEFLPHGIAYVTGLCFVANDEILLTAGDVLDLKPEFLHFPPHLVFKRVRDCQVKSWDIRTGRCLRRWSSESLWRLSGIPGSNDFLASDGYDYCARYSFR